MNENTTKITTASVRIALAYNYSTFEVSMNLENKDGISVSAIENARNECQILASNAVNDYKKLTIVNSKDELKKKIADINSDFDLKEEKKAAPEEIAEVEKMALYSEVKKTKK